MKLHFKHNTKKNTEMHNLDFQITKKKRKEKHALRDTRISHERFMSQCFG